MDKRWTVFTITLSVIHGLKYLEIYIKAGQYFLKCVLHSNNAFRKKYAMEAMCERKDEKNKTVSVLSYTQI